MRNEIKSRKRRFWTVVLALLLLLNQIPPIPGGAAEAYTVNTVYEYQVLNPGDTISNGSETTCGIYYYDVGEDGVELYSADITLESSHTVPEYSGNLPEGFRFAGWNVYSLGYISGGGVESIYLQAVISIDGTQISDSLYEGTLNPGTVIYSETDAYTISYYDQDGTALTGGGTIPINTAYKVSDYPKTEPTGYRFVSWKVTSVYASGGIGSLELTAQLEESPYTIRFVNEDGTELQSIEVVYGQTPVYTGETPTKAPTAQYRYTFSGWTPAIAPVAGDTTYTATFAESVNQYPIRFVHEDGTQLQSTNVAYGETPAYTGETPSKAATAQYSYTFSGWTPAVTAVTGAATYTATFAESVNRYTIRFVNEDGSQLQSSEVAYGATPAYTGETPIKAPTAQYTYTFAGWTPALASVTGEATYQAAYTQTANRYTITFDTSGGTSVAPITQAYGTAVTAPADPTRTGYTFVNWNPEIPAIMPAEDMSILARWTVNAYTITFDTDGGSDVAPITQDYATAVTAPENPTKEGYTFAGWNPELPAAMPAENITLTARWTANHYSIQYNLNGGTNGSNPDSYTYGTGVSTLANAVKPGYNFAGWYENPDFSGEAVTSIAADRTGDITLYARFEMGTIEAGTYSLTAGVQYKLGNVTKVSGDNSVYVPGSTFYVPASGTYTFS